MLDVPVAIEQELLLGLVTFGDDGGIDGFGDKPEPPYVATVAEAEDLYGEPVAFAMLAGKFHRDGYSLATKNDEDFTPMKPVNMYLMLSLVISQSVKKQRK